MALPSFPADDPATQEGELLLGPPGSKLRTQVREAAAAARRGDPGVSAAAARKRLARVPGVAEELAALDAPSLYERITPSEERCLPHPYRHPPIS